MRRTIAIAACATAVAAVTAVGAAPAQAAAPNPVAALKAQFKTGLGVKFSDKFLVGKQIMTRRTGTFQFGRAGVAASDISTKFNLKAAEIAAMPEDIQPVLKPEQVIKIGSVAYIKGGMFGNYMPEDKTWLRAPGGPAGGLTAIFGQFLNPTEPMTLQKLVKKAKRTGSVYTGKITLGEVYTTSKWIQSYLERPTAAQKKSVVSYKLYVNAKGLVTRVVTTTKAATLGLTGMPVITADTKYVGWGAKVSIKAPTEGIAEIDELDLSSLEEMSAPLSKVVGKAA
ncbi:hypothetical protein [Herbidospora sp. NBRC 101105]|uniref:hypothetical protein n=1 Tax=Herbidospora sp. NBRC 101105 TaxID=3032195 RepID=UPI0024A3632C|nr:hypothetical protein [Herbidospora sp. NBRC 101105]GLX95628.1 hypothetical protein Hesp01_35780 [Herbidospora sp. NBRC 101105]